ncbi:MAG: InlB B-repeat-containing protein [Clostridia bacterium]|nr:InlB B-repeat-containing protein [Clostridia bacterium]
MKIYTLTSTLVRTFGGRSWSPYWEYLADGFNLRPGKSGEWRVIAAYFFDATSLAALRSKHATSIKLTIYARDNNYPSTKNWLDIAYMLSNSTAKCEKGTADSTAATMDVIADLYTLPHTVPSANHMEIDLSDGVVPVYGYLIGPHSSSVYDNVMLDSSAVGTGFNSATLTVVTDEAEITYNANGGSGAPASQSFTDGSQVTLSNTVPTKSGSAFMGWATTASATEPEYEAGGTYTFGNSATLYAVWRNTYTVSFNANGGSNAPAAQTKINGIALVLTESTPTRTAYDFSGWALTSNGSVAYLPGAEFAVDANTVLYAVWDARSTIRGKQNGNMQTGLVTGKRSGIMKIGVLYAKKNGSMVRSD